MQTKENDATVTYKLSKTTRNTILNYEEEVNSEYIDKKVTFILNNDQCTKNLGSLPENVILVTVDVVGVYLRIPHEAGLQALKEALENGHDKQISTDKLVKMALFVLKNDFFEFNNDVVQQISGTAIGTSFAPPYAYIFMDQIKTKFLGIQKPSTCFVN